MATEQQLSASFDAKVRKGIFRPVLRCLAADPDGGEDRLQDAVAETWACYRRNGLRGKVLDDPILVHHCKQQALDRARHFVPADGAMRIQDAMSDAAYREGRVKGLLRIDEPIQSAPSGDGTITLGDGLAVEQCLDPARKLRSAIDLGRWLDELSEDDRVALAGRMVGEDLRSIGASIGVSTPTAHRRLQELGHLLAQRAGIEVKDNKGPRSRSRKQPVG